MDTIGNILNDCLQTKEKAIIKDLIWAMSLTRVLNTPMWIVFKTKTHIDCSEIQTIDYLPQINMSPTSIHAQKVAAECGQSNIVVTYDLAIAKMAMQIQIAESPKFDNIFLNLGGFHIQFAFFKEQNIWMVVE